MMDMDEYAERIDTVRRISILRPVPIEWSFVGRAAEQAASAAALTRPGARGIVLDGAPGMGKTSLMERVLSAVDHDQFVVRTIVTDVESRAMTYGAVAYWLPDNETGVHGEAGVIRSIEHALSAESRGRTLILHIDDAHLLDPKSAALIRHMTQGKRAVLAATIQTGEPIPEPLEQLLSQRTVEQARLAPLSRDEVHLLLAAAFGGTVEPVLEQKLWDATLGSPQLLRALVDRADEENRFADDSHVVTWTGPWDLAHLLSGAFEARLRRLDPQQRRAVRLLSLAPTLGYDLLIRLTSSQAVTDLEARRHITVVADGRRRDITLAGEFRRHHEAIGHSIDTGTKRKLQRTLADAIQNTGARRRDDTVHIARWRLSAGGHQDPGLLLSAARRTLARLDMHTSQLLAEAAIQAGGGDPARQFLADLLVLLGQTDHARQVLARMSHDTFTPSELVERAATEAATLFLSSPGPENALQLLAIAHPAVTEPAARLGLDMMHGLLLALGGKTALGLPMLDTVIATAPAGRESTLAHLGHTLAYATRGQYLLAQHAFERGQNTAAQSGQHAAWLHHAMLLGGHIAYAYAGDLAAVERVLRQAGMQPDDPVFPLKEQTILCMQARSAIMHGTPDLAVTLLKETLTTPSALPWIDHLLHCSLAHAAALTGQLRLAEQALAQATPETLAGLRIFANLRDQAVTWFTAAQHSASAAAAHAITCAARAQANGDTGIELLHLHDCVRLGQAAAVAARLTELRGTIDAIPARLYIDHAAAVVAHDGEKLGAIAIQFAESGAALLAAEANADAALAHHHHGHTQKARRSGSLAKSLAMHCQPVRTPALLAYKTRDLTPRERECVQLARTSLTARQIASRLDIAPATVQQHLLRSYRKLGINGRHQLDDVLGTND